MNKSGWIIWLISTISIAIGVYYMWNTVDIKVIDGCQYIKRGYALTHKGNCTNSIHIYNK